MPATGSAAADGASRFGWLARLCGRALAVYVRIVAATCRVHGPPVTQDQVVLAFWHEFNLVAAVAGHRLRPAHRHVSFSTRTFRGIVMNSMLAGLDSGSVPLPAEGRHAEAARLALEMARLAEGGASLVASPDGPAGPYRVAKPGALIVARAAGLPLQPWGIAVRPPLRLVRRWDRHVVPLPFCRLRVEEGAPLRLARREPLRPRLAELQSELDRVAAIIDARMSRPVRPVT